MCVVCADVPLRNYSLTHMYSDIMRLTNLLYNNILFHFVLLLIPYLIMHYLYCYCIDIAFPSVCLSVTRLSSSSRVRFMSHNWSATKQCLHLQSVAEISRHSVLSGDRIRQCDTSSGSRHKDTDQCQTL